MAGVEVSLELSLLTLHPLLPRLDKIQQNNVTEKNENLFFYQ